MNPIKSQKSQCKIASFDVDAQQTFSPLCPDELPVPQGDQIVEELNQQAQFARYRLGSKDAHSPHAIWVADETHPAFSALNAENADVYWPKHAIPGTKGFELLPGLPRPIDYDFFIWKGVELDLHPYGACYHDQAEHKSTGVIEFLKYQGVKTILVGGLAFDYCVKATVLQLCRAKFRVIVNRAATRGIAVNRCKEAENLMLRAGALFIENASQLKTLPYSEMIHDH